MVSIKDKQYEGRTSSTGIKCDQCGVTFTAQQYPVGFETAQDLATSIIIIYQLDMVSILDTKSHIDWCLFSGLRSTIFRIH